MCIHIDLSSYSNFIRPLNILKVKSFLRQPIQGVVLQTYGTGNCPSNRIDIIAELKNATDQGILIVNITQCLSGRISTSYETGTVYANFVHHAEKVASAGIACVYTLSANI